MCETGACILNIRSSHRSSHRVLLKSRVTASNGAIQRTRPVPRACSAIQLYSARVYSCARNSYTAYSLYTIQPYTPILWQIWGRLARCRDTTLQRSLFWTMPRTAPTPDSTVDSTPHTHESRQRPESGRAPHAHHPGEERGAHPRVPTHTLARFAALHIDGTFEQPSPCDAPLC